MGGEATDATQGVVDVSGLAVLGPDEFDALDAILNDLRSRSDETPQWEFCEGFMVALICCRRAIEPDEFLPVLMDSSVDLAAATAAADCFASTQQFQRFMHLWNRRWSEIALALDALVALTEDDDQTPSLSVYSEEGPASVSRQRVDALGEALWAVQELRALWRSIGPKVATVRSESKPGRNDPCPCGSGKKYKKCHGAG